MLSLVKNVFGFRDQFWITLDGCCFLNWKARSRLFLEPCSLYLCLANLSCPSIFFLCRALHSSLEGVNKAAVGCALCCG